MKIKFENEEEAKAFYKWVNSMSATCDASFNRLRKKMMKVRMLRQNKEVNQ